MTTEEAIRRLVDIGRMIKIRTEGDQRNYIALEMAINALQHTQRVETLEKASAAVSIAAKAFVPIPPLLLFFDILFLPFVPRKTLFIVFL